MTLVRLGPLLGRPDRVLTDTLGHSPVSPTFDSYSHAIQDATHRMDAVSGDSPRARHRVVGKGSAKGSRAARRSIRCIRSRAVSSASVWTRHSDLNRGPAVYETDEIEGAAGGSSAHPSLLK